LRVALLQLEDTMRLTLAAARFALFDSKSDFKPGTMQNIERGLQNAGQWPLRREFALRGLLNVVI
jgi:hypothetical protein